ncbi:hypothetical protein ACFYRJ_39330 [Streptomyces sp. NPDC005531]|uniref:hypothetical protein n=1 Tax=Streptomyces sp. NPDC005531 TaxID=3364722 RepID=UPI0036AD2C34
MPTPETPPRFGRSASASDCPAPVIDLRRDDGVLLSVESIFYDHDGQSIPAPGIVIVGEIDSRAEAFKKYDGTVDVAIEAID